MVELYSGLLEALDLLSNKGGSVSRVFVRQRNDWRPDSDCGVVGWSSALRPFTFLCSRNLNPEV